MWLVAGESNKHRSHCGQFEEGDGGIQVSSLIICVVVQTCSAYSQMFCCGTNGEGMPRGEPANYDSRPLKWKWFWLDRGSCVEPQTYEGAATKYE